MISQPFSPSKSPQQVIIALHGWTGNVRSMESIAKTMNLAGTKWLFLQAPYEVASGGYSWFNSEIDMGWDYESSFRILLKTIQELNHEGFSNQSIFILGFSQGACLGKEFIIRQKFSIGGLIAISGFIRFKKKFTKEATKASLNTPILIIHGSRDKVILPEQSKVSFQLFNKTGYYTEFYILSGGHKIPIKAKELINNFIKKDRGS